MFHEDRQIRDEIRHLKKQIKRNPLLFARMGDCYLRLGNADQAEAIVWEGIAKAPDYTSAYRVLAEIQFWKGFYREAEENCRKGLERDPDHLGLLHLLMRIKKKEDNDLEAGQLQKTLARLDPLHAPEYVVAGDASEPDERESDTPSPGGIWKMRAARAEHKMEGDEAEASKPTTADENDSATTTYPKALPPQATDAPVQETNSGDNSALELQKHLGEILDSTEKPNAEETSNEASESEAGSEQDGIATRTLAELYAKQGKYDESIEVYRRLLDSDPLNEAYQERLQELVAMREAELENPKANMDG